MRILVVNQFHRQPGRGGGARLNELARFWNARGHEVTVIASTVDHASGTVAPEYGGRFITAEAQDGGTTLRVATPALDKSHTALRVARDLSFAVSAGLAAVFRAQAPDVVVASSPPLFPALTGEALARGYGVPWVFEVRDLWPDYAVELGILRGWSARAAFAVERHLLRHAAAVVPVTPAFVDRLAEKGVPHEKMFLVPNGVDVDLFHPAPADDGLRARLGWDKRFVCLYAGVHGPAQALGQVLDAAEIVRAHAPDVLFAFVGTGTEKESLMESAKARGLDNVSFHPQVPGEMVPDLQRAADVGLATLRDLGAFRDVFPAKIFEVMACGRPLLLAAAGAAATLVDECGGGLVVPPEKPALLAEAVLRLREDSALRVALGARGALSVHEQYDRRKLAEGYLSLLVRVAREG